MPMTFKPSKTPKGYDYLLMRSSGDVTAADAENLLKELAPGSANADMAILALVDNGSKYSAEARQAFTRTNGNPQKPVAVVVNNAPLRVMISFIIRMSGAAANTRFFGTETDAVAFLDEKLSQG